MIVLHSITLSAHDYWLSAILLFCFSFFLILYGASAMSLTWYCHLNQYIVTYILTDLLASEHVYQFSTKSEMAMSDITLKCVDLKWNALYDLSTGASATFMTWPLIQISMAIFPLEYCRPVWYWKTRKKNGGAMRWWKTLRICITVYT